MVNPLLFLNALTAIHVAAGSHDATRDEIFAMAKQRSIQYCSKLKDAVCELTARRQDDGWWVHLQTVTVAPDGERLYGIGGDNFYVYSLDGKFLKNVPGL